MKILIIQNSGKNEKNKHMIASLSLKKGFLKNNIFCDVYHPNVCNEFPKFEVYDYVIDMLELYDQRDFNMIQKIKCKKILWVCDAHVNGELPYKKLFDDLGYSSIMKHSLNLFSETNSFWTPPWFDPDYVFKKPIIKNNFIGFCGNRHPNRNLEIDYIKSIGGKLDIFVIGDDMVNAVNSYFIHFNKNLHPNHGMSYRVVETLACATCLLTNQSDMNDIIGLKHLKNCLIYNSFDELVDIIKWSYQNIDKIKFISENGYDLSKKFSCSEIACHTINHLKNL